MSDHTHSSEFLHPFVKYSCLQTSSSDIRSTCTSHTHIREERGREEREERGREGEGGEGGEGEGGGGRGGGGGIVNHVRTDKGLHISGSFHIELGPYKSVLIIEMPSLQGESTY